jgi:hypothetical protein
MSGTAASPSFHAVPTSSWQPGDLSLDALARGTLRGGFDRGTFCVWLATTQGRSAIIWPAGYHTRLYPLELLDARDAVVAKGGDLISVGAERHPFSRPDMHAGSEVRLLCNEQTCR